MNDSQIYSKKNYGTSIILCGIFGPLGIHHFYIGNYLHGIFDLSLLIIGVILLFSVSETQVVLGVILLCLDVLHTIIIFFKLIVENQKDGNGKLIVNRETSSG